MAINTDIRIIDLKLGEFIEFLDKRYGFAAPPAFVALHPAANALPADLDVDQCAQVTGYKPDYIRQLVHHNKIPFYKRGKLLRFELNKILAWNRSRNFVPVSEAASNYINNNPAK